MAASVLDIQDLARSLVRVVAFSETPHIDREVLKVAIAQEIARESQKREQHRALQSLDERFQCHGQHPATSLETPWGCSEIVILPVDDDSLTAFSVSDAWVSRPDSFSLTAACQSQP